MARSPSSPLVTLDRWVGRVCRWSSWLALPLALLLCLQWPLREMVQAYSREANDLGQLVFALLVAVAIGEATRRRVHLGTDILARRYSGSLRRRLHRYGGLVLAGPWALFVLWSGADMVWRSVAGLEAFPETFNPGYFLLKAAVAVLALLVLVQALLDAAQGEERGHDA